MHPRTQEILSYLDANQTALEHAVNEIPEAMRQLRAEPDSWSVAEIIEHLTIVERRIRKTISDKLDVERAAGLGAETDTSPVIPTFDVSAFIDRSQRITARDELLPTANLDADAAWSALAEQRRMTRDMITAADGLALGLVTIPHARLGLLNVYQWLVFLGAHEARHTAQVREVGQRLDVARDN
jgi:uncharacterized damage-inducible protein DinB